MRRLWAYIIVVFAAVVAVIASFPSVAKGISTDGEFKTRRVFTFQLTQRDATDDDETPAELTNSSAKDVADIMKQRLETYNVSTYDLTTTGNDIITVSFAAESDTKYEQIINYLGFSGSFALVNQNDNLVEGKDFLNGAAYTKSYSVNEYPTVIIPVKTDSQAYEELIQGCIDNPEQKETGETNDEGEATTEDVGRIYFLFNWQKGETYQILKDSGQLNSKVLLTIDFTPDDDKTGLYYDSDKNSFSQVCGFQDANGNGYADPKEVREAYAHADYLINLFSASKYDYNVKCIKGLTEGTKEYLAPKTEEVRDIENKLVWNRTLTTIVALIIIISLLLVFFYKLGAVSIFASTLLTAFFTILMMVRTGLLYNSLGVVGAVAVVILSLVSGIIYLNKIKEDSYRGHTLKKANAEAAKKSLLPIVDIHVVGLIVGVMIYAFGGATLRTFSAVLAIGSIISFIINALALRGLMWLPTNSTALNDRYDLFGINKENVPNHMAEEKQTFYGQYTEKNFSKHKKSVGVISGAAFILSLVGIIAFGAVRGGDLFGKNSSSSLGNEIYIQNRILVNNDETSPLNDTTLNTIMESILIQKNKDVAIDQSEVVEEGKSPETYFTLKECVGEKILFSVSQTKVIENESKNYLDTYFRLTLTKQLSGDEIAEIKGYTYTEAETLKEVFEDYFQRTGIFPVSEEQPTVMSLKASSTVVNPSSPRWDRVILGTVIALLIITVYLSLRYRLSRGLSSLIFPMVSSVITIGIMLLLGLFLNVSASVIIAVPVVSIFAYLYLIQFYNRERELLLDDKVKDNSKEHRAEVAARALGIAYTPILATAVIGIYCLINFFGFAPAVMSNAYAAMFVGAIIALGVISSLIVPICNLLFNLFSKVKISRKPKEKKNKNKPVKKSAEPEEAIFIGIND